MKFILQVAILTLFEITLAIWEFNQGNYKLSCLFWFLSGTCFINLINIILLVIRERKFNKLSNEIDEFEQKIKELRDRLNQEKDPN